MPISVLITYSCKYHSINILKGMNWLNEYSGPFRPHNISYLRYIKVQV